MIQINKHFSDFFFPLIFFYITWARCFFLFYKTEVSSALCMTFLTYRNKLKGISCFLVFKEHSQCYFLLCVCVFTKHWFSKLESSWGVTLFSITAECILWVLLFSIPLCPSLWLYFLSHISDIWNLVRDNVSVEGQVQMEANSQRIYNFIYVALCCINRVITLFIPSLISLWDRLNR